MPSSVANVECYGWPTTDYGMLVRRSDVMVTSRSRIRKIASWTPSIKNLGTLFVLSPSSIICHWSKRPKGRPRTIWLYQIRTDTVLSATKARSLALSEWRTVAPASRCAYNDDDERAVTMCGWEGNRGPAESNDTLLPGLLTVVTSLLTA